MIQFDPNLIKLEYKIDLIIKKDLFNKKQIKCCPICGSTNYIKYGSYKEIQRFKCKSKSCGKTFSLTTNSIWSYSKKSSKKWIEFMELMMEKRSLRYCAEKLKISLGTAFYWRHKILNGFMKEVNPSELCDNVHIGKGAVKENFKGKRNITTSKREDIWIIAARGNKDSILVTPICKKVWNFRSFQEKIYSKIYKNSYITAYGDRYLQAIAKKHNNGMKKKKGKVDNCIKYFRSNLNIWMSCFHGIGTKYLKKYLSWFILFYLEKKIDYMDITYELLKENNFLTTKKIRDIKENM
ncbi:MULTISPECIES: IS1 family transposase [Clostridium]|uniref:IS1 family transposase n=1 Tax=Clostridium cibarium TaxID=2762247 RepID=A0ABR8PQ95_9CLOT|nr:MULTISPECIES: IS1 family transposase [Clostridium]MBD7910349.1 IS1 family transposase [Clostridium cibarium]